MVPSYIARYGEDEEVLPKTSKEDAMSRGAGAGAPAARGPRRAPAARRAARPAAGRRARGRPATR